MGKYKSVIRYGSETNVTYINTVKVDIDKLNIQFDMDADLTSKILFKGQFTEETNINICGMGFWNTLEYNARKGYHAKSVGKISVLYHIINTLNTKNMDILINKNKKSYVKFHNTDHPKLVDMIDINEILKGDKNVHLYGIDSSLSYFGNYKINHPSLHVYFDTGSSITMLPSAIYNVIKSYLANILDTYNMDTDGFFGNQIIQNNLPSLNIPTLNIHYGSNIVSFDGNKMVQVMGNQIIFMVMKNKQNYALIGNNLIDGHLMSINLVERKFYI